MGIRRGWSVQEAWRRRGMRALVGAGAVGALALAVVGPVAAAPTAQAVLAASSTPLSQVWEYTGAAQQWTVPANVSSATFDVYGAQGGGLSGTFDVPGGRGGQAKATLSVTPGDAITIMVGGAGLPVKCDNAYTRTPGGFNGGGAAEKSTYSPHDCLGASGGGGSDVRIGGTSVLNRSLVAGGGGGASGGTCGFFTGAAGAPGGGTDGETACGQGGGKGGTWYAGGGNGRLFDGGLGANPYVRNTSPPIVTAGGGGGGGGFYGGGGGGNGYAPGPYGGGGGSGYGPAGTVFSTGAREGNGRIAVSYTVDLPLPLLTLVKEVDHGDTNGQRTPQDWTLSAVGPVSISGQSGTSAVTSVTVPVGRYALTESGPKGYTASSWSCQGAVLIGNEVILDRGYQATCTIKNTAIAPRLTLIKKVDNGGVGTATPDAWTLHATGLVNLSGTTGSPAVTDVPVKVGNYHLFESGGPPGYYSHGFSCDGGHQVNQYLILSEGDQVTCTITNTVAPPHLTLVKQVENDQGGTATARAWTLSATGPTTVTGRTGDYQVTNVEVAPGAYTLSETGGPGGYAGGAWSCTDGTLTGNTLTLGLTDVATCTIVNRDQPGLLTLRKQVEGGRVGTTRTPADWTLTATPVGITGQPTVSGNGANGVTGTAVSAGRYTLSESGPAGFTAGQWQCAGGTVTGSTLTVANGAQVSCSITNTVFQQRLTLVKVVDNGTTGGTAGPGAWTLSATGPTPLSGASGTAAVTSVPVAAGAYALAESGGPSGYSPSAWRCTGGTVAGATVTVAAGVDVTCTITNTAQPSRLTLVDTIDGDAHGPIHSWWLTATGPVTITGKTGSKWVTDVSVPAGTYVLTHSNGSHSYTTGIWTCNAGTLTGTTLQLPLGVNATCTLIEHKEPHAGG